MSYDLACSLPTYEQSINENNLQYSNFNDQRDAKRHILFGSVEVTHGDLECGMKELLVRYNIYIYIYIYICIYISIVKHNLDFELLVYVSMEACHVI